MYKFQVPTDNLLPHLSRRTTTVLSALTWELWHLNLSPSCFVVAHIYMERFIESTSAHLTSVNVHRLLITSVMLAAKFIDDAFYNNAYYARVGGVTTKELNKLEMKFLFGLDFQLHVSVQTFGSYCSLLEKEGTVGLQIERSIQACRISESWSNKDDSTCAQC
ncbi:hypothetical protein K7X08_011113 [Anisodus acutangulus]|uniref:Cyclin n=1 Tax=Anisodus acutangulus TaxID=402998 RepID=A0A9Q1LY50_9SOLA|nr:hypothetical protein K7X08_011113 [Anisodus acutangulus]